MTYNDATKWCDGLNGLLPDPQDKLENDFFTAVGPTWLLHTTPYYQSNKNLYSNFFHNLPPTGIQLASRRFNSLSTSYWIATQYNITATCVMDDDNGNLF